MLSVKMWKRMESYVIARPTGQIENGKHAKYSDKKGIPEFWRFFFYCRYGYIMHVSVYENCRIQNTSIWYKNHQNILNVRLCNKSYDRLHPGTVAQNSSQIPVRAQGFVGSPPHPGCIMIYSYYQMCPAVNSKPNWSNKQVVPLLGCCSDAPGSIGNSLVICGDWIFFQLNFRVQSMPEFCLEKFAALLQYFVT